MRFPGLTGPRDRRRPEFLRKLGEKTCASETARDLGHGCAASSGSAYGFPVRGKSQAMTRW
jgi:hypothetical protein